MTTTINVIRTLERKILIAALVVTRKLRQEIKERDLCCRLCWSKGVYSEGKEVHHIIPREVCDDDQIFDAANCIYLCHDCHATVHGEGWQKYVNILKGLVKHEA